MIRERAAELTSRFDKHLLVIGDVMLDRFVWGSVGRNSPEAPACEVLRYDSQESMLGGAGNVAANLGALGAHAQLVGLFGDDRNGDDLQGLIHHVAKQGWLSGKLLHSARPTTTKTRYVAGTTHLLRVDSESTSDCEDSEADGLLEGIHWPDVDGIIVQDYAKGVVTPYLINSLMELARLHIKPVFVDPKSEHWELFKGASLVKSNLIEARSAYASGDGRESVLELGQSLLQRTQAEAIVVTQGQDGMSLFSSKDAFREPSCAVEVVDVSGAGDTSMAALVLSRLAGASWAESLELANAAAGIAVGKRGTSTVTTDELLESFH